MDPDDPSRVSAMTGMLAHRGPDDFGYLMLDSRSGEFQLAQEGFRQQLCDVCLGHRRLSIIDLSVQGRQPMSNETNDCFVIFNGEIFNYLELRSELTSHGHHFRSQTDTEVIVHSYEEWGEDCVTRFNGKWAFVIWDQRCRVMFCSRDRFGIKPFYYHLNGGVFLFASEIKGILPALERRPSAHPGVLSDYLIDGSLCRTNDTFFEGIQSLVPAHNLTVSADRTRTTRYWDAQTRSQTYNQSEPVETFRDLLADSVKLRLRSDVPVGIALSGGIDSTSILTLASNFMPSNRPKSFTAVFPGDRYDEYEYAKIASQASGSELFCVDYQPGDFIGDLSQVIWSMDYPALEGQVLPRWELMRLASRHVKVILEGQGADEMLAGYVGRYFAPHFFDELARKKSSQTYLTLRELFSSAGEVNRRYGKRTFSGLVRHLAPKSLPLRSLRGFLATNRVYTKEFVHSTAGRRQTLEAGPFQDRLTNLLHFDLVRGILPMLLKFGDALSMAFAVESRLPFLDHRLVEFVFSLSPHHKLRGSQSKGVLRQAMTGLIPEQIRDRNNKVGFNTPLASWLAASIDTGVRPLLLSKRCKERGIFDVGRIEKMLNQHASGHIRAEDSIFRWISVELWFRLFIDGDGMRDHLPAAQGLGSIVLK